MLDLGGGGGGAAGLDINFAATLFIITVQSSKNISVKTRASRSTCTPR